MSGLKKLEKMFIGLIQVLMVVDFAAMIILVLAQVVVRFVAANAMNMSGAEELTRFLLCYLTFLGATLLYEQHGHVWVANLVDAVPAPVRKVMLLVSYVVQIMFFIAVFIGSKDMFPIAATQSSSVLHIPMNVVYAGMPFMAACCLVFCIRDIVLLLQGKGDLKPEEGEVEF